MEGGGVGTEEGDAGGAPLSRAPPDLTRQEVGEEAEALWLRGRAGTE